ncbi:MAG: hypothetical protein AAFV86_09570 [Pseudomonadota bacterium]
MTTATLISAGEAWAWAGGAVAAAFLLVGLDRVEPSARGAYAFRVLLIPGLVLLWPLVLWRWWRLERGAEDGRRRHDPPRRAQGTLALAMALAIPVILATALTLRQTGPLEAPAVRLAPPETSE